MSDGKVAQISTNVDSTGAQRGFNEVKQSAAEMATSVDNAGQKAGKSLANLGTGGTGAAANMDRAARNIVQNIERTTAALNAGGRSTSDYYRLLAQQRGVDPSLLKPYLDALDAAQTKQRGVTDALTKSVPAMQNLGMSAGAYSAALRTVPAQVTDIVVGLQSGQAPMTVLLQQGGQLKDVFGGVGNAAKALGSYALSLVNPYTVLAASIAGVGYAYYEGTKESEVFTKALISTGNAAGTTLGQLQVASRVISEATGASQGAAAEALTAFAATGQISADKLGRFAAVALKLERETGAAVADTVKQFVELGKDPVGASVKLNQTMNYLTESVYRQIKALDEQGRTTEAAFLAQRAFFDAAENRTGTMVDNLGYIEAGWRNVSEAVKRAASDIAKIGRTETPEVALDNTRRRIAEIQAQLSTATTDKSATGGAQAAYLRQQLETLQAQIAPQAEISRLLSRSAAAEAERAAQVKARIAFDKDGEQFTGNTLKMEREIAKARKEGTAASATQAEIEARIQQIRKKYTDKGEVSTARELARTKLGAEVDAIQKAMEAQVSAYTSGEKTLEALRSAGLVSETDYYAARRGMIERATEAKDDALAKEIARYSQEKLAGKDKVENDRRIAELESNRARVQAEAASAATVLNIQQAAASKQVARSYEEARIAAQAYLDTTSQGYARELAGVGRGDKFRKQQADRNSIDDRYSKQRQELENRFTLAKDQSPEARKVYEDQLAIINEYHKKALDTWEKHYGKIETAQADWAKGASRALENYVDATRDTAKLTEDLFTRTFKTLEDSIVEFTMTGEFNFKKFADSIISEMVRMQVQQNITAPLANAGKDLINSGGLNDIFSKIFTPRASGGPISAGTPYLVGEKGPELILPTSNGLVIPNQNLGNLGGGSSITVNITNHIDSRSDQASIMAAMHATREQVKSDILSSRRAGGVFA